MTSEKRYLFLNTLSSLAFQLITVICGFIVPRLILNQYGSEVNGLLNSIAQFLSVISFLELGVGAVIKASLYGPIARRDWSGIGSILAESYVFFRRIALVLLFYVGCLCFLFPLRLDRLFPWAFDVFLIVAMSGSYFAQYYFGIVDALFLSAAQREYVKDTVYSFTLVLNTVLCFVLIRENVSIQLVKLTTSIVFLVRPILIRLYIKRHFPIQRGSWDRRQSLIPQKWNGVAQHLSAIILDGTDVLVLTVFSSLRSVSVYSVYAMVFANLKNLFFVVFRGIQAYMGNLWAREKTEELKEYYQGLEWIIHLLVLWVWYCTARLIVPFVLLYTNGISNAEYNVPVFAAVICLAYGVYCLRLPCHVLILSVGRFKETQGIYILGALCNVVTSIVFVRLWGLVGVAIGTLVALSYQYLHMHHYVVERLGLYSYRAFFKQLAVDSVVLLCCLCVGRFVSFNLESLSLLSWLMEAIVTASYSLLILVGVNALFYWKNTREIGRLLQRLGRRR